MNPVELLVGFLADPASWEGTNGIPNRLLEHVQLSGASLLAAALVAMPVGLLVGHTGRGGFLAISVANVGRAVPSYALLLLFFGFLGLNVGPIFATMVLLAIPPILAGAYVAIREVDRDMVEAARGMGMSERQLLLGVELPVGLPLIVAGTRTAAVQVVATATLGALIAGGGLGRFIVDGFALRGETGTAMLLGGAVLVALLAVVTERAFTLAERRLVSPGLRLERARAPQRPGTVGRPGGGF